MEDLWGKRGRDCKKMGSLNKLDFMGGNNNNNKKNNIKLLEQSQILETLKIVELLLLHAVSE